ncbi:MAG: hypothetical protein V4726_00870 [Verrucomicrobiota bacterium]
MRAKFKIDSITRTEYGDTLKMSPVSNGQKEDNTYSKFTPSGSLTMEITNPELIGTFTPGETYHMDFTKAG